MMNVKRILIVDDYFEMLSFLRSMLELSNQAYRVVGVPSAEEGMLELQQTPYDLLITDLRLPGMSGFDLVRRVRRLHPSLPVIMITAYTSDQRQQEAADLGIFRYFRKPLDTDELLAAIHDLLYDASLPAATAAAETPLPADHVARRLAMLRADTAAAQVVLARMDGELLHDTGGRLSQEMPGLMAVIAHLMAGSYELARQLGSVEPFTMQYQAGQSVDVYSANVGANHLISIFLDASAHRSRIGTVWVFAQRAVNELLPLLPAITQPEPRSLPASPPPLPPPAVQSPAEIENVTLVGDAAAADVLVVATEQVDLDAFWEQATESLNDNEGMQGISWEEARQQGLIGKNLGETPAAE